MCIIGPMYAVSPVTKAAVEKAKTARFGVMGAHARTASVGGWWKQSEPLEQKVFGGIAYLRCKKPLYQRGAG